MASDLGREKSACHVTIRPQQFVLCADTDCPTLEMTMTPRLAEPHKAAPAAIKAMMALESALGASGLDHGLLELVKLRASQINGCAFCIHMHATYLRKHGESEMRLHMLNAWRESSFYSARERA